MRILVVGSDKVYAIENLFVKYLRESGNEVFHFSAQSMFYDFYQKNLVNKLLFKAGLSSIHLRINKQFKVAVSNFQPDVIWVFKGMEIRPESLIWAKKLNIKLVNYNPDNPFIFSGSGSGNNNLKRSIPLYDLHLTYNSEVKKEMEATYRIPTEIVPFGFDFEDEVLKISENVEEVCKPCFLGNPDKYRGRFLQDLAEHGIELDVYGNNWNKFVNHGNINIFEPVYDDKLWITLRKYRIQLNLMRPHNLSTHNMRSFEIPGIGGIQLAPDTMDHSSYFEAGKDIFLYTSLEDCVSKIKEIILMSENDCNVIRLNARERSLVSGYTYKDRTNQALKFIEFLREQ